MPERAANKTLKDNSCQTESQLVYNFTATSKYRMKQDRKRKVNGAYNLTAASKNIEIQEKSDKLKVNRAYNLTVICM